MSIEHSRVLKLETPVRTAVQVIVAAPRTAYGREAAARIHRALLDLGANCELLEDPAGDARGNEPGLSALHGSGREADLAPASGSGHLAYRTIWRRYDSRGRSGL